MFKSKIKFIVVVIFVIFLVGCNQSSELQLISSNLKDYDLMNINPNSLKEINLEYNKTIADSRVVVTKNKKEINDFKVTRKNKTLNISNLNLSPTSDYRISILAKDQNNNKRLKTFKLFTTRTKYPSVERKNETLLQSFYWYMGVNKKDNLNDDEYNPALNYRDKFPEEIDFWNLMHSRVEELNEVGFTALWLPPAHKGHERRDEGYGVYDIWDLGEFEQVGTKRTKYGTRSELDNLIDKLHQYDIKAYYDIVMNQRMHGRKMEVPLPNGKTGVFKADYTDLKGRQYHYSNADEFQWDWHVFDGVPQQLFKGHEWDQVPENDALLGLDVDYQNQNVQHELKEWGEWIINDVGFDGYRIDAIKHVHTPYVREWLQHVQNNTDKDMFFIGEAWMRRSPGLIEYLDIVNYDGLNAFDFPLRMTFLRMSKAEGTFDMEKLSSLGLVNQPGYKEKAVTFVDNHDVQRDNSSPGVANFELQAYAYILMRQEGVPTIFYKDYYHKDIKQELDALLKARKYFAYGAGYEVNNNTKDVYSYVREGLEDKPGTGMVMMISDGRSGKTITKSINSRQPNTAFYDYTGNIKEVVVTDGTGRGNFKVKANEKDGYSIWVPVQQ